MKASIVSTSNTYEYIGSNNSGHKTILNANKEGISPMENLLLSVAACSCVDVEMILKKMRNDLDYLHVEITGDRVEDQVPKPFKAIHLHFNLYGDIKEKSAEKAISMAVEKYCSVASSLDPKIRISHAFSIHTKDIENEI